MEGTKVMKSMIMVMVAVMMLASKHHCEGTSKGLEDCYSDCMANCAAQLIPVERCRVLCFAQCSSIHHQQQQLTQHTNPPK